MTDAIVALVVAVPLAVIVADALADRLAFSLPTGVKHAPHVSTAREWDRHDGWDDTTPRPFDGRDLRRMLTPDPKELLVFLGIIGAVLGMSVIGVHP